MIPNPGFFLERLRGAWLELLATVDTIKLPALPNATPKVAKNAPAGKRAATVKGQATKTKPMATALRKRASVT